MHLLLVVVMTVGTVAGCGGDGGGTNPDAPTGDGDATIDSPSGPATINLTLNNRPMTAATFTFLVAYQDGSGAWTLAPAPTGDTYSFPVSSATYAVAWTCLGGPQRTVTLAAFATAERTSLTMDVPQRCTDRTVRVQLSGTISNRGNTGALFVEYGDRRAPVNANTGAYSLEARPGTNDLFVLRTQVGGAGMDSLVDRVAVQRGVMVSAAATVNVDFATAADAQTFAVTGPPAGIGTRVVTTTTLYTATDTDPLIIRDTTTPYVTRSLAAAQMTGTDVYDQAIIVSGSGQTAMTTSATATPAALTYAAPAPLGGAISTVPTSTPYPTVNTTWAAYTNAVGYTWQASQQLTPVQCGSVGGGCTTTWNAQISPTAAAASPSYQMPDLSALAGWSTSFQFVAGTVVNGATQAMTSSVGQGDFPERTPAVGTQRTFVRSDWTVTP